MITDMVKQREAGPIRSLRIGPLRIGPASSVLLDGEAITLTF